MQPYGRKTGALFGLAGASIGAGCWRASALFLQRYGHLGGCGRRHFIFLRVSGIGRAAWRGRVGILGGGVLLKKKKSGEGLCWGVRWESGARQDALAAGDVA